MIFFSIGHLKPEDSEPNAHKSCECYASCITELLNHKHLNSDIKIYQLDGSRYRKSSRFNLLELRLSGHPAQFIR